MCEFCVAPASFSASLHTRPGSRMRSRGRRLYRKSGMSGGPASIKPSFSPSIKVLRQSKEPLDDEFNLNSRAINNFSFAFLPLENGKSKESRKSRESINSALMICFFPPSSSSSRKFFFLFFSHLNIERSRSIVISAHRNHARLSLYR
jgi:hypothetical protein